jgi:predicted nucleic acid-binding protein
MTGKPLLDTNIIIALFKKDHKVISALELNKNIAIPSIVIGKFRII